MGISKKINLAEVDPAVFLGPKNANLNYIKSFFPKLKIGARGSEIFLSGEEQFIHVFEVKFNYLINYFQLNGQLDENIIEQVILSESMNVPTASEVILHGIGGSKIKARTINQKKLVQEISKKDLVFAIGPAGTGKTYTAVAMAVKALKNKEIKRIILTRPAVEAGENLGFLPGDLKEKLDPYLMPLYDALRDMIPKEKLNEMLENGVIEIAPLAFMRGRTLDKAFVILDEAQNATFMQMKMFLTRMGKTAKFVITGDISQIDLPTKQKSGLKTSIQLLKDVEEIGIISMTNSDVIRHTIVKKIVEKFDSYDVNNKE